MFCIERPALHACKVGGDEPMYMKDRAECYDYTLRTVGNTYQRPGWRGLGGLIVSSIQAEENKENLRKKRQWQTMQICLEGRQWKVELRKEAMAPGWQVEREGEPAQSERRQTTPASDPRDTMNQPAAAPPRTPAEPPPRPGQWTFVVEKVAHSQQCEAASVNVVSSGAGFENYSVLCSGGDVLVVRCDHGNCRVLK